MMNYDGNQGYQADELNCFELNENCFDESTISSFLWRIMSQVHTPFLERKMIQGTAETINEEIEDLYSEIHTLEGNLKQLLGVCGYLMNNYEERMQLVSERKSKLVDQMQKLSEDLSEMKRSNNELEIAKQKLEMRNNILSQQISKIELLYSKSSKTANGLQEEITNMNEYEDKLYKLEEDMTVSSDQHASLKQENAHLKQKLVKIKEDNKQKLSEKNALKAKYQLYEEKLNNMLERQRIQETTNENQKNYLEFLKKKLTNLKNFQKQLEKEKAKLQMALASTDKQGSSQAIDNEEPVHLDVNVIKRKINKIKTEGVSSLQDQLKEIKADENNFNIKDSNPVLNSFQKIHPLQEKHAMPIASEIKRNLEAKASHDKEIVKKLDFEENEDSRRRKPRKLKTEEWDSFVQKGFPIGSWQYIVLASCILIPLMGFAVLRAIKARAMAENFKNN